MSFEYWYVFPYAIFVCILATSSGFSGAVLFQPFFYFFLKIPISASIATGIATETIGMSGAAYRYAKMNYHDFKAWRTLIPWTLAGVILGFIFFVKMPSPFLKGAVGVSMILVGLVQFVSLNRKLSHYFDHQSLKKWGFFSAFSGAFSATTGTGVAELNQPLIEHVGQVPTKRANATAILLEANADWLITLLNIQLGNINYEILIFSVSGVLIGSQIGPRIAPYLPDRQLKIIFSTAVTLIGVFYLYTILKTFLA